MKLVEIEKWLRLRIERPHRQVVQDIRDCVRIPGVAPEESWREGQVWLAWVPMEQDAADARELDRLLGVGGGST